MPLPVPAEFAGQKLTPNQIGLWARQGGFPESEIPTAIAVALAESSGRIDAIGGLNLNGTQDYGVWQINNGAHKDKFAQWPQWWTVTNANMAYAVWRERQRLFGGTGWEAWSVYQSGAYRLYLALGTFTGEGTQNATSPEGSLKTVVTAPEALVEVGNAVKNIADGFQKAGVWMSKSENWIRVAQIGVGAGLIIAAITVVIKPAVDAVAGPAAKVAAKAVTKGAV
jgi:hypothetical protein